MTGFARADGALGRWTWAVEARSVNGRTLEARFRGPSGFEGLERVARDGAQARFGRGQIQISLQVRREETTGALRVNTVLLDELIVVCDRYRTRAGLGEPRLDGLLAVRGVVETAEETETPEARAELEAAMGQTVIQALDRLKEARAGEGAALAPVLSGQVDRIAQLVAQAETEAAAQIVAIRERFTRRMAELIPDPKPLEERIVAEAAMLAGKADVREELDRLAAHIAQARELLTGDAAAGRRLDFLTQEFMRETNTLCSKSATIPLTGIGLELKAVIEQFREQVQNVE